MRHQSNVFAINRKTLAPSKNPKEDKRAIKRASVKWEIGAFFEDASILLPDKKHVSKISGKHRALLEKPDREQNTTRIMQTKADKRHSLHSPSTDHQTYAQ